MQDLRIQEPEDLPVLLQDGAAQNDHCHAISTKVYRVPGSVSR